MTTGRLGAFADGVFAIAATLLILDIRLGDGPLGEELREAWSSYLAYAISFFTIGIMWVNHHVMCDQLGRADRTFLFLNILLLMCIAFVPFPTRLVAEHIEGDGARDAALAYGCTLTVTATFFSGAWFYAMSGGRLLKADVDPRTVSGISRSYLPGPFVYFGSTLVAFVSPALSVALFGATAIGYVIESSLFGRE